MTKTSNTSKIAIIGGGSIGVAFAVLFTSRGFKVSISDPDPNRRRLIESEVFTKLKNLERYNLIKESVDHIITRLKVVPSVEEAVLGADLVQECVPERLEIKQPLFQRLALLTQETCVLASSSSFMASSEFSIGSGAEDRILVAHPGNPPFAIPVIELVPNPNTSDQTIARARETYSRAGMSPVLVNMEQEGFIFNRLQGALLREAYSLVRDGIASVDDIDAVVRDGLGRRWAFMGPFETVDLNTRGGIASHAEKMGPSYQRMGLERGDSSEWTPELVSEVSKQRREILPLEKWEDRVHWRDEELFRRLTN
ncbi:3-hydroxyacyl-CoA dehydrogenase [Corynebacterium glutamicum MT]|uniref:3-hydroxyacyl-CoA dehydrogenase n=1 Tax=Corynebacterium glutamicum TaxID=1718 RepID=UPI000326D889|nr:3-hydroxyacyl-CoA dehydrogenase [Corynebacterium glutamicum]EOA64016.1 3-hydroxyacyl-CoA dehydrogenase [Corynebacterium glutamicum MT]